MNANVRMKRQGKRIHIDLDAEMPADDGRATETIATVIQTEREPQALTVRDGRVSRSQDYTSVNWFGTLYTFNATQRDVVALLWDAWKNETPFISQAAILELCDIEGKRLRDVFRENPAWGTMIRLGSACGGPAGTYCLWNKD